MSSVRWSRESLDDMQLLAEFIRDYSPSREQPVMDEIFRQVDALLSLPRLGKVYESDSGRIDLRSLDVSRRYRVIYALSATDEIEVVQVLDVRRSLKP